MMTGMFTLRRTGIAWGVRLLGAAFLPGVFLLGLPVLPAGAQAPAGITSQQVDAAKQAIESGATMPPGATEVLEAHPELKEQLPPEMREKLKEGEKVPESGGEPSAPPAPEQAALAPYDWKFSVYVSGLFSKRLREDELRTLSHFGHEIFAPRPGTAAILENMPVAPGYVIGPGDEVVVRLWGRMEGTYRMVVDRDGKIFFPKIGSLYVAGKTFDELKSFLRGKVGNIAEVSSDVSLGQMKGIRVSVVGEVRAPGWYNVSSLHTALQVLSLAGGVKDIGSLRRIELRRGGETVETIDLYDFLLHGDSRADTRLLQGDTIFVPVVGNLVALAGEVRRPAIYELGKERTLRELVEMGGGFAPAAYKRRVQVERLEGHFARIVLDVNAEDLEKEEMSFPLADGDIVRILPITLTDINVVTLEGNVMRPGKYELKPGMTVRDLLPDATAFLPKTYFEYALLKRFVPPDMTEETIPLNLRRIIFEGDAAANIALRPLDKLTVYRRSEFLDEPKASVQGEVRRPGRYEIFSGMRISDLVMLGGDLTRNASLGEADLTRFDEQRNSTRVTVHLGKALAGDESENLPVREEDVLIVRPVPDFQGIRFVTVTGEVRSPGVYTIRRGERLSSLIERADGFTPDAYLRAAQFTRVSTRKSQQEAIERLIDDLEVEVAERAQEVTGALDKEDIEASKQLLDARRSLIAKLKKVTAKGRVVIRLAEADRLKGTPSDILLEDGDRLEVPRKQNVVNVVGRVYNPTGVVYDPANDQLGYYLNTVGGPTKNADRDQIFLIKADGSVVTKENVGGGFFVFGERGLMSARVEPGDSIVVPEKLIQVRLMKDVKDITQILYQIAVATGVLFLAF
jgi:protein involved in polysaccharide export with SLBB domain